MRSLLLTACSLFDSSRAILVASSVKASATSRSTLLHCRMRDLRPCDCLEKRRTAMHRLSRSGAKARRSRREIRSSSGSRDSRCDDSVDRGFIAHLRSSSEEMAIGVPEAEAISLGLDLPHVPRESPAAHLQLLHRAMGGSDPRGSRSANPAEGLRRVYEATGPSTTRAGRKFRFASAFRSFSGFGIFLA